MFSHVEVRKPAVERESLHGCDVVSVAHGEAREGFLSCSRRGDDPSSVFQGFAPPPARVTAQLVFGGVRHRDAAFRRMGPVTWPVMWLQGDPCSGEHLAGTQAFLIDGPEVRPIRVDGQVVGSAWSDEDADWALLVGLLPPGAGGDRAAQARGCFEAMDRAVGMAGFRFLDVIRTWFFLDRLLEWYDEFNAVRTRYFAERGVFDHRVPASTGIGAGNPSGSAVIAGALAMRPRRSDVGAAEIGSPLQCPATDYRSSFSRAVEVRRSWGRQVMVSGTASIAPGGATVHVGDAARQIDRTLDVVEAILESRGMKWADTVRSIGYFQDMRDLPKFSEALRRRGLEAFPFVPAHATVCRHDLLFELELDAVSVSRD